MADEYEEKTIRYHRYLKTDKKALRKVLPFKNGNVRKYPHTICELPV
ncbi:MAG: hypothetical protein LBI70_00420 [Rickettsiales bacterium]|jgi:hypothetical protein|nr:hypothetical protein [Rickettsiales bacterium]